MAEGRFPPGFIDRVSAATDIAAVIGRYTALRARGSKLLGLCPFHNEKTPSFSVDAEKGLYYCFGCHAGGTVFTFLMEKEGLTFAEAVETLARDAGIPLPEKTGRYEQTDGLEESAEFMAELFARALKSDLGAEAREYLKQRGISQKTWETFALGWAPADQLVLPRYIEKAKKSFKPFIQIGLIGEVRSQDRHFAMIHDALVFPIQKPTGKPVGFAHRRIREAVNAGPKYVNSADNDIYHKSSILYGLPQARPAIKRAGRSLLVEGYFDVIGLYEHGIQNAVACCGTALTSTQASILSRYAPTVVVLFDGDSAGLNATLRSIEILLAAGLNVRIVRLPEDEDPDSFVKTNGAEALLNAIQESPEWFDWLYRYLIEAHSDSGVAATMAVAGDMSVPIGSVREELARDIYIRKLADLLAISEDALRKHLRAEFQKRRSRAPEQAVSERIPELPPLAKLELALLAAVVRNGKPTTIAENPLKHYPGLWEIAVSGISSAEFLASVGESRAHSRLAEILIEPMPEDCDGHIAKLLEKINRINIDCDIERLNSQLRLAESRGDSSEATRIFGQISELAGKLGVICVETNKNNIRESK